MTRREMFAGLIAASATGKLALADPAPVLGSAVFDWNDLPAKLTEAGSVRSLCKERTATLDEPEHGLTDEVLAATDVLIWWGHCAHGEVKDEIVAKVHARVLDGMGLIVLHSGHFSKIFQKLMGTTCNLKWREAGEKERIWVTDPTHPISLLLTYNFPSAVGTDSLTQAWRGDAAVIYGPDPCGKFRDISHTFL